MTVVSEMLGVPTPGFEWVYPPASDALLATALSRRIRWVLCSFRHEPNPPRRAGSETPPRADFTNSSLLSRHGRRYSRLHAGNFFGTIAPSVLSSLPPSLNTAYRPNGAAPESIRFRYAYKLYLS